MMLQSLTARGQGRWLLPMSFALLFAGCTGNRMVPVNDGSVAEARVEHKRAAWLAYEHEIELEVAAGQSRPVSDAVKQACTALPAGGCTVIEASNRGGSSPGATIKMRVTPAGVNKVLAALDGRGKMITESTTGKDLAEPIQDVERKMAMLTGYRDQLQTLARQRALDPEALIKLHRELAAVQSEIDSASGTNAQLRNRVDTELLTVALQEPFEAGERNAVRHAVSDFGNDLLQGVAMLITFVASTIPFAIAGSAAYFFWRRLRARRRKGAAGGGDR